MKNNDPNTIVAEITRNWRNGITRDNRFISKDFELIVEVNERRGYVLRTFSFSQLMTDDETLTETIIAVFDKKKE